MYLVDIIYSNTVEIFMSFTSKVRLTNETISPVNLLVTQVTFLSLSFWNSTSSCLPFLCLGNASTGHMQYKVPNGVQAFIKLYVIYFAEILLHCSQQDLITWKQQLMNFDLLICYGFNEYMITVWKYLRCFVWNQTGVISKNDSA